MYSSYLHSFNKYNSPVTFHLSSFILTKSFILVDEQLFYFSVSPLRTFFFQHGEKGHRVMVKATVAKGTQHAKSL